MRNIKVGDWVDIYEDPVTETKLEGRAKILSIEPTTPKMVMAKVQFENGDICVRLLKRVSAPSIH